MPHTIRSGPKAGPPPRPCTGKFIQPGRGRLGGAGHGPLGRLLPVTIDAVLLGFETQRNDPLVGLAVKPFYPETGAVERIDDYTAQFNLLEPRPVFTDYAARMTDRDASRRAKEIDGKLIAEMQEAASQPA